MLFTPSFVKIRQITSAVWVGKAGLNISQACVPLFWCRLTMSPPPQYFFLPTSFGRILCQFKTNKIKTPKEKH